jgi:diguanylate cyclase (GGDEF)-like protein
MAKFYKDQHYNAYIRQEQLKINEKTLADLYSHADKLSKTDTLTEINNRRYFSDMLNKKMQDCEASQVSFYLVIFDVDHFKEINDSYGHTLGDKVLVKVVEVVKSNIRSNDFIGRFGGDEFIICLDFPNKEGTLNRLTKIRDGVRALGLSHDGKKIDISVSIGAAKFMPGTNMTEKNLIEKADFELFNVKKTTRGEISVNE